MLRKPSTINHHPPTQGRVKRRNPHTCEIIIGNKVYGKMARLVCMPYPTPSCTLSFSLVHTRVHPLLKSERAKSSVRISTSRADLPKIRPPRYCCGCQRYAKGANCLLVAPKALGVLLWMLLADGARCCCSLWPRQQQQHSPPCVHMCSRKASAQTLWHVAGSPASASMLVGLVHAAGASDG